VTVEFKRWIVERRGAPLFYHGASDQWYRVFDYAEAMSGECLGRANMQAFGAALEAVQQAHDAAGVEHRELDEDGEYGTVPCYRHEYFGGAFGRGEWLFVNPDCHEAVDTAREILERYADYPVIDDEEYARVEWEEVHNTARDACSDIGLGYGHPEFEKIAPYIVARCEPDNADDWYPDKRDVFWGYVEYRRALRREKGGDA